MKAIYSNIEHKQKEQRSGALRLRPVGVACALEPRKAAAAAARRRTSRRRDRFMAALPGGRTTGPVPGRGIRMIDVSLLCRRG